CCTALFIRRPAVRSIAAEHDQICILASSVCRVFLTFESGFSYQVAYLDAVFGIVNFSCLFLRRTVFGVHAPCPHALLMFELNHRHSFAVFGEKTFVGNVAWHGLSQFAHASDQGDIFLSQARHQAGAEDSDDHGESPQSAMLAQPIALLQFRFRMVIIILRDIAHYSALASIASMSSSDRPK